MRISRQNMFMEMARIIARRGTCPRLCVGAIAVSKNRQMWIGYNGSPAGSPHCTDVGCNVVGNSCIRTDHAEVNAINQIPSDVSGSDVSLYTTHSPCLGCAKAVIQRGIGTVYFETPYRDTTPIIELLAHGVTVHRLMPNGYILDFEGVHPAEA